MPPQHQAALMRGYGPHGGPVYMPHPMHMQRLNQQQQQQSRRKSLIEKKKKSRKVRGTQKRAFLNS